MFILNMPFQSQSSILLAQACFESSERGPGEAERIGGREREGRRKGERGSEEGRERVGGTDTLHKGERESDMQVI